MAFKAIYDKKDDIPEDHREHYTEVDGKFHLDTDFKALGFENAKELKTANDRLKRQKAELREEVDALKPLKKFENLLDLDGFDPADIETILASANPDNKEAIEAVERKYGKQIDQLKTQVETLTGERDTALSDKENFIITNTLQSAAVKAKVREASLDDVVALNRNRVLIENGKVYMKDADGDSTGQTPEEYFKGDYRKDKSHFFEPDGPGGTGNPSKTPNGGGGAATKSYKDAKTLDDKVAAIKAKQEARAGA